MEVKSKFIDIFHSQFFFAIHYMSLYQCVLL